MTAEASQSPSRSAAAAAERSGPPLWGVGLFGLEVVATWLVFFVAAGDPAPHRNEAHYLCRLKHYWDPAWCAGDLFLESPEAHFTIVVAFGWLTRWLSLGAVAWVGRALSWALLAWAWVRLSRRVAPGPGLAPLGAGLLVVLTEQTHFAGEWIVGGFEAKSLAYGFVLLGLVAWLDRRANRAWAWMGVATASHALVGGWSTLALLVTWLTGRRRPTLTKMAPGLALGFVVGLAGVIPPLLVNRDTPAEVVSAAHQVYVFERLPHHLSPLTKPPEWLAERGGRFLGGLALMAGVAAAALDGRKPARVRNPAALRMLIRFGLAALGVAVAGLAVELILWNSPATAAALLRFYWFRLADIAAPLATTMLVVAAVDGALAGRWPALRTRLPAAGGLLGVVLLWGVGGHAVNRLDAPHAPADARMIDPAAWDAACRWIDTNLPADAVLLVPRSAHTFKWRAERADVVTYKDVPQDAARLVEWRRRYRDVFQAGEWDDGSPRWAASLGALGRRRLLELGKRYGATYALSEGPRGFGPQRRDRVSLPVVRRWGPYTLYALHTHAPPASHPSR